MKWYQGQIDARTHAYLKAEAQLNKMNIPEYINAVITEHLKEKGYNLEAAREQPRQAVAAE